MHGFGTRALKYERLLGVAHGRWEYCPPLFVGACGRVVHELSWVGEGGALCMTRDKA